MAIEEPRELPIDRISAATVEGRFAELLRSVTPDPWIVPAILSVDVVVYVVMLMSGRDAFAPRPGGILAWGANYGPRTLGGQPWRLLVAVFLHFGAIHLFVNMVALWKAGGMVERLFGHARFAAIYLAAGLCGSVASLAVHPRVVSAGASGAVFGVYGALAAFLVRQRGTVPTLVRARLGAGALAFIVFNIAFGFVDPNVDGAAHVGGLVGGAVAGVFLAGPLESGQHGRGRAGRPAVVVAVALAFTAAAYLALPRPTDLRAVLERFFREEARIVHSYRAILERAAHPMTSDAETAAGIEEQVLGPWRATTKRLAEPRAWTLREREMLEATIRYADAREKGWAAHVVALRSSDPASLAASLEQEAEAARLLEELKRWNERGAPKRP